MSQQNVQAMRDLYDAFSRGDLDTLEKGISRDILWNEAENSLYSAGNPYRNFAAIRDGVLEPSTREYDNFRVEVEQVFDAGATVVTTGRYRGKNKETGRELSAQFCHVLHVDKDGKLEGVQEYVDTLQEAEVAGRTQRTEQIKTRQPMPA
jgi:ketosteroid isomerase-like protein